MFFPYSYTQYCLLTEEDCIFWRSGSKYSEKPRLYKPPHFCFSTEISRGTPSSYTILLLKKCKQLNLTVRKQTRLHVRRCTVLQYLGLYYFGTFIVPCIFWQKLRLLFRYKPTYDVTPLQCQSDGNKHICFVLSLSSFCSVKCFASLRIYATDCVARKYGDILAESEKTSENGHLSR
jgi:hypothetical protein